MKKGNLILRHHTFWARGTIVETIHTRSWFQDKIINQPMWISPTWTVWQISRGLRTLRENNRQLSGMMFKMINHLRTTRHLVSSPTRSRTSLKYKITCICSRENSNARESHRFRRVYNLSSNSFQMFAVTHPNHKLSLITPDHPISCNHHWSLNLHRWFSRMITRISRQKMCLFRIQI